MSNEQTNPTPESHDDNCFLAMGGGGLCTCSQPDPAALAAETKVLPRFPGYREMAAEEILADGDMSAYSFHPGLKPTVYQGQEVGESGAGLYFRPIDPVPHPAPAKAIGELSEAELDDLAVKSEPAFQAKMDAIFRPQAPEGTSLKAPVTPIPSFLTYAHALFRLGNLLQEFKDNKDNGRSTVTLRSEEIKDLREAYHAFKSNSQMAATNEALSSQVREAREALQSIVDAEDTHCGRCDGSGQVWADGKAHYQGHTGPLMACPSCGGAGKTESVDLKEIAVAALALLDGKGVE